jgi:predicted AAA+ superfamily ATPase
MLGIKVIKVITGLRRIGKTTLFKQFQQELKNSGIVEKNIIYLNLEEMENEALLERHVLHDYIMRLADKDTTNYVFLDEIQMVSEFERVVNSLFVKDNIDLYITGSNAYFLSSDLATLLTGRCIEIKVMPFSFTEFLSGYKVNPFDATFDATFGKSKVEIFNDYFQYGGFPEVLNLLNEGKNSLVSNYLSSIFYTILEKDIMKRNTIRSKFDFENLTQFMFDSMGSLVSPNSIAITMTNNSNKINKETVDNYLSYLTNSFIFYYAQRYDLKGKKLLQTLGKFYAVDLGFSSMLFNRDTQVNKGHLLENIVYLELIRRYKSVYVGKNAEKEVDFVAKDENGLLTYYQVSLTVRDEQTLNRELTPLQNIKDNYPKYLLTLDPEEPSYNGILQKNTIHWLLEK